MSKPTQATRATGSPARRLRAFGLAMLLLAIAWPPLATLLLSVLAAAVTFAATHLALTLTAAAAVLLTRSAPGLSRRAITALAGPGTARLVLGATR